MILFRSIRFKITLWYMLLLLLTLFFFSTILYGSFNQLLYSDLDDLLSSRGEGVANSITAFWGAKETAMAHGDEEPDGLIKNAAAWVEEKRKDPELMSIFVQILNKKGERLVASKYMPRLVSLPRDILDDIFDGEESFDTVRGELADGKKADFRIYSKPVIEQGRVEYIVQVAGPISLLTLAERNLLWILFALLPLTVVLAGLPGILLVGLTLRPVDTMIRTLRQTTAENLKLKIHIPDTRDEIKRLADTFNEMTERLDRSFTSQQSFIQDLSGELKVPLASLKAEFEDAAKRPLAPEDYSALIRHGLEEMQKFSAIIEDLETLAKFDNSRIALEIRKVDLPRLLGTVLAEIRAQADQKEIALSSFLQEPIMIDGDEQQLKRLFTNLLENAIRYTYRKGRVTVAAHREKSFALVTITDTGIGIEEHELSYIFDRFYQINKSRAASGGFGLGLSIAKSVAETHKGMIAVESAIGKGSTFTVTLPLSYPG